MPASSAVKGRITQVLKAFDYLNQSGQGRVLRRTDSVQVLDGVCEWSVGH